MPEKQPIEKFPVGNVTAAVWEHRSERGSTWFHVTFSRCYRDGETCRNTTTFRRDDLLDVAKASEMAFDWIRNQQRSVPAGRQATNG